MNLNAPVPGWYRNSAGRQQWWDGEKWGPEAPQVAHDRASTQQATVQTTARPVQTIYAKPLKSVGVAYVFLIFLGNFGAHRFYIGSPGLAILFILSWAISAFAIVQNVQFGQDPIFTIALIVYIVLYLFDLFALAGKVRKYNARHQFDFR